MSILYLDCERHDQQEKQLTVLILYGSWHVGARLIHRLSRLRNVTVLMRSEKPGESIQLVAEMKPGIVVIDAQLGQGSGIEVLREVKSFTSPPIVIMTASSPYSQYRRECLRNGADLYFELPAQIEQLSNVVFELTDRSFADDGE